MFWLRLHSDDIWHFGPILLSFFGCQKFVKKLFAFFSKEKATKKPIVSFDRVYQKTSKALGVSYTSVHHIMNGKRPFKSNRPKERANILDDFDHCVIKRTIHDLYSRKIAPTVSIIHKEIKDSIKKCGLVVFYR